MPIRTVWIEQRQLTFFVQNPRIYSIVRADGNEPDQDHIYARLLELEHVRELKEDIKRNGGLIDPLIVRSGTLEVLEGNSRLAACRWLYENDPDKVRWATVKCTLLPEKIDEKLVYALLGQYHVKGKKDWAPYETAGFLYRRFKQHKDDLQTVSAELGMKQAEAQQLIEIYEFMLKHAETDPQRWSYYEEFIKSRKIKKVRDSFSNFDDFIVKQIREQKIERAVDLRQKLPVICEANPRTLKRYIDGSISFDEAHERAVEAGGDNHEYKRLNKMRRFLSDPDTEREFKEAPKPILDKILFELGSIEKHAKRLKQKLNPKDG